MEIIGTLKQILPETSGTSKAGNEWKKQDFVVETDGQYPKNICFTLFGDKTDFINGLQPGDQIKVLFDVESREYNGRWYHNINAWNVEKQGAEAERQRELASESENYGPNYDDNPSQPDGDDLPF